MKPRNSAFQSFARIIFVAILFSLTAVAQADVTGNTLGSTPSSGLSANFKRASKITLTVPATMTDLCAYLDGLGGASGLQPIRLALYRDASGVPGAKVAESPEYVVHAGDARALRCTGVEWMPLQAGSYWVAIISGSTAAVARYFLDGTAQNWFANNDVYQDGASSPFGAGNPGAGTIAAQLVYWPANELSLAGNAHIGARISGGMTANMKRASSFTLPTSGRVRSLRAYFDGHGSNSTYGSQSVRLAIYSDSVGTPNSLVFETNDAAIPWGQSPSWADFDAPNIVLPEGKYWIAIHSGPNGEIGRYYFDGTQKNWFGNADDYSDGAAKYFDSGSLGEGTISAFLSYKPGPFASLTFGSGEWTSTSTIPANTMRGSRFSFSAESPVLNWLYTVIDGRGGQSGSQDLRMLVYTDNHGVPDELVVKSDVVTVNAGWPITLQTFPIKAMPLAPGTYWLMLQSGAGEGVARIYQTDAAANSVSAVDEFANGPAEAFGADGGTVVTGAVTYAMYGGYTTPQR